MSEKDEPVSQSKITLLMSIFAVQNENHNNIDYNSIDLISNDLYMIMGILFGVFGVATVVSGLISLFTHMSLVSFVELLFGILMILGSNRTILLSN